MKYAIEVRNGQHCAYELVNGREHLPIERACFDTSRKAIAFTDMRERGVSPLRSPLDDSSEVPGGALRRGDGSSGDRSGLTSTSPVRRRSARGREPIPSEPASVRET